MSWFRSNFYSNAASVDWSNPVNHKLAGIFLLSDTSHTSTYDLARLVSDAVYAGTPTKTSGPHGPAMAFGTGKTSYASIVRSATVLVPNIQTATELTVTAWINHASDQLGAVYAEDNTTFGITFNCTVNVNKVQSAIYASGSWFVCASLTSIATNRWYHIAYTAGPGGQLVYINGILDNTNASTATNSVGVTNTNRSVIGAYPNGGSYASTFDGSIESVMLWKRQLKAREIFEQYSVPYNNLYGPNGFSNLLH